MKDEARGMMQEFQICNPKWGKSEIARLVPRWRGWGVGGGEGKDEG